MPGTVRLPLVIATIAAGVAGTCWALWPAGVNVDGAVAVPRPPRLAPDCSEIVIPANIAPLNFAVREPGTRFFVRISSETGEAIEIVSRAGQIIIPPHRWRALLETNRGKPLRFDVWAEVEDRWQRYQTVTNRIAEEDIDSHLVYRLVGPIHNKWRETAVYQRDLAGYGVSTVLDGKSIGQGCVNCHSFPANDPQRMLIGMRSDQYGRATLLTSGDTVAKLARPFGYTAWHPSGEVAAYSINKVRQFFHTAGPEVRDVIDMEGDLGYLRVAAKELKTVPRASDGQNLATYPAWSPDGRYLYYSSAPVLWSDRSNWPPERYAEVKYSLMRVSYDIERDRWGTPEMVLSADETGLSVLMARISPDGRFLLFCMCRYGCFPVYQPTSDLYLMRLADRSYRRLAINSEFSESYHSWSSNSRWIAFSSRRQGGLFTRCYLSYLDEDGQAHKPFVLPQKDPAFYDSLLKSICVPELVAGPVATGGSPLVRAARSPEAVPLRDSATTGLKPEALEPWQPAGR